MFQHWKARIASNPAILAGKPIISGTRISVELILGCMASGWSREEVLEAYPHITPEDVLAALAFAADVLRLEPYVTVAEVETQLGEKERKRDLCP